MTWPGAVYSLEVGINGTHGVLTIDDTHRDMVLAVSAPQSEGYAPDKSRLVDFMGSYPPGDMVLGELRGPMARGDRCRGSTASRSACRRRPRPPPKRITG